MMLGDHLTSLLARAQIRQAILRRIGNTNWGVEVGVLKIAADSIIGSLLRYGSAIFGSCMPPNLIRKIDTQVINAAARGVCAADRSMRKERPRTSPQGHIVFVTSTLSGVR